MDKPYVLNTTFKNAQRDGSGTVPKVRYYYPDGKPESGAWVLYCRE